MTSQQRLSFEEKVEFLLKAENIYNKHLQQCAAWEVNQVKNWTDWLWEISTTNEERNQLAAAFRAKNDAAYYNR